MAVLGLAKKSRFKQRIHETKNFIGYVGKETKIRAMSSWESKSFMIVEQLVKAGRVKGWASEESVFQYSHPYDDKSHKYYMDLTLMMTDERVVFIEVKPFLETIPPKRPKNSKNPNAYQDLVKKWVINKCKWDAVRAWCEQENRKAKTNKFSFVIWTENELRIKK